MDNFERLAEQKQNSIINAALASFGEAVSPVTNAEGNLLGAVRVGTVLNRNFDFVDFVRENIFTVETYEGKNLGTVTIRFKVLSKAF